MGAIIPASTGGGMGGIAPLSCGGGMGGGMGGGHGGDLPRVDGRGHGRGHGWDLPTVPRRRHRGDGDVLPCASVARRRHGRRHRRDHIGRRHHVARRGRVGAGVVVDVLHRGVGRGRGGGARRHPQGQRQGRATDHRRPRRGGAEPRLQARVSGGIASLVRHLPIEHRARRSCQASRGRAGLTRRRPMIPMAHACSRCGAGESAAHRDGATDSANRVGDPGLIVHLQRPA